MSSAEDLLEIIGRDTKLTWKGSTKGGEYCGPCPWCGGEDRFLVWPHAEKHGWWCRVCDRKGDAAGYLMQREGLKYPEALRRLEGGSAQRTGHDDHNHDHRSSCEDVKSCDTQAASDKPAAKAGLTVADLAVAKKLPEHTLLSFGVRDESRSKAPRVAIPYLDEAGCEVALRYRLALDGDDRFLWKKGAKAHPYGLQRLAGARKAGWLLIGEGESDCWTAWHHGIPMLGLPGKSIWRKEWAANLAGLDAFIWQEPDAEDFTLRLAKDLPEARVIVAPEGIKDISEAHCQGHDVAGLLEDLKASARPVSEIIREQVSAEAAELEKKCRSILEASDPLELIKAAIRGLGYGGDIAPAIITYLCLTTRLLKMRRGAMPAHLLLIGPPSTGKSYSLQIVLLLLPVEAYHTIDAGSPRVLVYDSADLQHRVVVFSESDSLPAGEDNPAASAVRSLLQDHYLHYKVTVPDPKTGQYKVQEVAKPGPSVMVTTSVHALGGQLGSRTFTLPVPEDMKRIQQALVTQAELEINGPVEVDAALVDFQEYLQRLAPWDVLVPFALELATEIGKSANATRILRDFARLLSMIKAVALLRHARRVRNAEGRLVAEIEDYAAVHELVGPMYEATITGATEQVKKVVQAVADLRSAEASKVTYSAVAAKVGLHPEQVKRQTKIAIKNGWLTNDESRPHQPANLNVGEPVPTCAGLPTPTGLAAILGNLHGSSQDFTVSQSDRREEPDLSGDGFVQEGIPTMFTKQMLADLRALGYAEHEIDKMTPAEAWKTIRQARQQTSVDPQGMDDVEVTL